MIELAKTVRSRRSLTQQGDSDSMEDGATTMAREEIPRCSDDRVVINGDALRSAYSFSLSGGCCGRLGSKGESIQYTADRVFRTTLDTTNSISTTQP